MDPCTLYHSSTSIVAATTFCGTPSSTLPSTTTSDMYVQCGVFTASHYCPYSLHIGLLTVLWHHHKRNLPSVITDSIRGTLSMTSPWHHHTPHTHFCVTARAVWNFVKTYVMALTWHAWWCTVMVPVQSIPLSQALLTSCTHSYLQKLRFVHQ